MILTKERSEKRDSESFSRKLSASRKTEKKMSDDLVDPSAGYFSDNEVVLNKGYWKLENESQSTEDAEEGETGDESEELLSKATSEPNINSLITSEEVIKKSPSPQSSLLPNDDGPPIKRRKSRDNGRRGSKGDLKDENTYKYGRLALIGLALFSIPVDAWKMYDSIVKSASTLDGPTSLEIFDYYSAAITTHVIGMSAAFDNRLAITIGCRLVATMLYQSGFGSKGNSTVPTDPKELQKYIKEHVPRHRLPKGYRFQDLEKSMPMAKKKASGKKKGKKGKKSSSKSTSSKKAKSTTTKKSGTTGKSKSGTKKTTGKKGETMKQVPLKTKGRGDL